MILRKQKSCPEDSFHYINKLYLLSPKQLLAFSAAEIVAGECATEYETHADTDAHLLKLKDEEGRYRNIQKELMFRLDAKYIAPEAQPSHFTISDTVFL